MKNDVEEWTGERESAKLFDAPVALSPIACELLAALKAIMDGVDDAWLCRYPNKGLDAYAAIRKAEGLRDAVTAAAPRLRARS